MSLSSAEEIIEEIRQGRMVVLVDDEDRENEGDLIMAATAVTADDINFMARYGRGLICLTLTRARCEQLHLPLMVSDTHSNHATNFTVSIEAAEGVTTGISAADRATTVLAAVKPDPGPDDLTQPGHIFPLMAQDGGVLTRAGHTEAGCDLARLAGLEPASVIVEILNEDGTMARRPQLEIFAAEHGLKMGAIADLIHYRVQNEKTVERVAECTLSTLYGTFRVISYQDVVDAQLHLALVFGEPDMSKPVLVRVHLEDQLADMLSAERLDGAWPLKAAMERVAKEGAGVIVILKKELDANATIRQVMDYQMRERGISQPQQTHGNELRTYGVGAQILLDVGVHEMRVLGQPKRLHGLSGFGLEVVEYVPCN